MDDRADALKDIFENWMPERDIKAAYDLIDAMLTTQREASAQIVVNGYWPGTIQRAREEIAAAIRGAAPPDG